MPSYRAYSRTIFGRKADGFEGVDNGFDPHAEPISRVPYSMDIDYTLKTLKKRRGYDIIKEYNNASVMSIANVPFEESDAIAIVLGSGDVYFITEIT